MGGKRLRGCLFYLVFISDGQISRTKGAVTETACGFDDLELLGCRGVPDLRQGPPVATAWRAFRLHSTSQAQVSVARSRPANLQASSTREPRGPYDNYLLGHIVTGSHLQRSVCALQVLATYSVRALAASGQILHDHQAVILVSMRLALNMKQLLE